MYHILQVNVDHLNDHKYHIYCLNLMESHYLEKKNNDYIITKWDKSLEHVLYKIMSLGNREALPIFPEPWLCLIGSPIPAFKAAGVGT